MERKSSERDQAQRVLEANVGIWKEEVQIHASEEALQAYRNLLDVLASAPNEVLQEEAQKVLVEGADNQMRGSATQLQAFLNLYSQLGRALGNFAVLIHNTSQDSIPAELKEALESFSNAMSDLSNALEKLQTGKEGWGDTLREVGKGLAQLKAATHKAVQLLERHRFFEPQANYVNQATFLLQAIANFWREVHGEFLNAARRLTSPSHTSFPEPSEEGEVKGVREDPQVTAWYHALEKSRQKLVDVADRKGVM